MKKIFVVLPLLVASLVAHADLVIEQKLESAMMSGNLTSKIKGDLARVDMPTGPAGAMSTLINTKTGDVTSLLHGQKMLMKVNINDSKAQIEAAQKAAGVDKSKVQPPKATGQKEKVGEWDAEIYTVELGGTQMKLWSARDFPNADTLKAQMAKLAQVSSGGMDPKTYDVPGMIVKTEVNTPQGKMTTTLVGIKEQPVADSEFQTPADYKEMKLPGAPGAQ